MARKQNSKNDLIVSTGAAPAPVRRKAPRGLRPLTPGETPAPEAEISSPAVPAQAESNPLTRPSSDEIAALAYSYWEARGYQGGSPEEDWHRAEQELRARTSAAIA